MLDFPRSTKKLVTFSQSKNYRYQPVYVFQYSRLQHNFTPPANGSFGVVRCVPNLANCHQSLCLCLEKALSVEKYNQQELRVSFRAAAVHPRHFSRASTVSATTKTKRDLGEDALRGSRTSKGGKKQIIGERQNVQTPLDLVW